MNKTLIFLCISCTIIVFSIIAICTAPIITGAVGSSSWKDQNCQYYADYHKDREKHQTFGPNDLKDDFLKYIKEGQHMCERQKAMYGLEYASYISDLFFGVLCGLLSLLHYFEKGKYCEKVTGIIGLACGVIGFILTIIYIIYSGYIFTHDGPGKEYDLNSLSPITSRLSRFDTSSTSTIIKLNKDRAFAEWKDNKFKCLYYKDEDHEESLYAKYNDLGKKQYNYHKDFEYADIDSDYKNCRLGSFPSHTSSAASIFSFCKNPDITNNKVNTKECKYLYFARNINEDDVSLKYKYDKWVTNIIFGCFILVLNLGLALFGFLLFKQTDGQSGAVALK